MLRVARPRGFVPSRGLSGGGTGILLPTRTAIAELLERRDSLSAAGFIGSRTADASLLERRDTLSSSVTTGGGETITITAASAALADVQDAVDDAVDGDVIGIPNGSATWSGGISTTKQIRIRAVNITPTPAGTEGAGTSSRNVVIVNNSTTVPLFNFQTGNSFHVGVAGIRFDENVSSGVTSGSMQNHLRFTGTGSKVPLVNDCYFECGRPAGNQPDIAIISFLCQGGVMWNCVISGEGFSDGPVSPVGPINGCLYVEQPRAWTTASTMGSADTNGDVNLYLEDCNFIIVAQCPDIDDRGRVVMRHCHTDGSFSLHHGFTSTWGGRHAEYYDNEHVNTFADRNFGYVFWVRGGTFLSTDNFVDDENQGYGNPGNFEIGDNTSPSGSYLIARQPGCGHNGTSYVSDPIYCWNNTGPSAYAWAFNEQPGGWSSVVQEGRDVFVNDGAKPSYTKYTYPHPARASVEG